MKSKTQQPQPEKTDKFGYASLMVGDSAALFTRYMEEYGTDYGMAARNIGRAFAADHGRVSAAMVAGQRFLNAASACLPLGLMGAVVTLSSNLLVAASQLRQANHTRQLASVHQEQLAMRRAQHLLQLTKPEAIASLIEIAEHYGREEEANTIHLVVADSYQAVQLQILLVQRQKNTDRAQNPVVVTVFDNLQEAFDAASTGSSSSNNNNNNNNKILIYFHTLEPIHISQDLQIQNCRDFVLRSDAGQTGSRLVLTGKVRISQSTGTFHAVAICGDVIEYLDQDSHVQRLKCVTGNDSRNLTGPSSPPISGYHATSRFQTAGLFLLATPFVVVASTILLGTTGKKRTKNTLL